MFAVASLIQRTIARAAIVPLHAAAAAAAAAATQNLSTTGTKLQPRSPLTIYHVPGTRSIRVIWVCEELGVSYEKVTVSFSKEYRSSPEWRALNPGQRLTICSIIFRALKKNKKI